MPRTSPPLTDAVVRNAKPKDRAYKLAAGRGLYLLMTTEGRRYWRFKYRLEGREKLLALGVYPDVSLAEARRRRDGARVLLEQGIDPSAARKAMRETESGADSFEAIAREWYEKFRPRWAPSHASKQLGRLEADVLPYLGSLPAREIEPPEVLAVLRRVEERAVESAHRVKNIVGQIMRYAVATGRADRDPTPDLRGALAPAPERHYPAILEPVRIGEILRMLDSYAGSPVVRAAIRLQPLLFCRPGELRSMRWKDLNLDAAMWDFEASKTREPHFVPLAPQAIAILEEIGRLTAESTYVFPSLRSRDRPISDMAMGAALRRLGIDTRRELTSHSWRAIARTLLEERLGFPAVVVELQLGHRLKDPLGRAYNRTTHLEQRRRMMHAWAGFLDGVRDGSTDV